MPRQDSYILGIDLGLERLTASLARIDKKGGIEEISSDYCLTRGVDKKGVTNIAVLVDVLKDITAQLKNLFSEPRINDAFVCLDGAFLKKVLSSASLALLERGNKIINNTDIKKVVSSARALVQHMDEEIIYSQPLEFLVDDQIVTDNPLGLYAHKLEVRLLCLITSRTFLDNITYAFRCAGYDIEDFLCASLCSSLNIDKDKRNDCAVIDFGRHSTDIVSFKNGRLEDVHILDIGSFDIAKQIANKFDIPLGLAEELKNDYRILDRVAGDDELLLRKTDGYQPIKRSQLSEDMIAALKLHFIKIKETLFKYACQNKSNELFATGEDVFLDGFLEIFSEEIGQAVNILPCMNNIKCKYKGHANLYDSSLGAIRFAISNLGNNSLSARGKNIVKRGVSYIKELYQEYF